MDFLIKKQNKLVRHFKFFKNPLFFSKRKKNNHLTGKPRPCTQTS